MSTRATLTISDIEDQFHIYRHHDGYPDTPHGVIHDVREAMHKAWPLPRFEAADFGAALVAQMKHNRGSVYLTKDAKRHLDSEYHYDITADKNDILLTVKKVAYSVDRLITQFEGTLEEAIDYYKPDQHFDGTLATKFEMLKLPIGSIEIIKEALSNAEWDINQHLGNTHDPDSQKVIGQIKMAKALLK